MIPRAPLSLARNLLFERDTIAYLIFFVTGRCNAKCALCFYWDNIVAADAKRELSMEEIGRVADGLPNLPYLTLTGGEPFLRDELPEIAETFYRRSRVRYLVVPTNGLLPERVADSVERIVTRCPKAYLKLQLSIDGVGEEHDRQRGVPGNFDKMLETYRAGAALRKRHRNFNIDVSTILSPDNVDGIFTLVEFIEKNLEVENHNIAMARADSRKPVDREKLREAYDRWSRYRERKPLRGDRRPLSRVFRSIYEENMAVLKETLATDAMVMPCHSGRKMLVISEYGDVYPCEPLHQSMGNLRDHGYDLSRLRATPKARELVSWIVDSHCHCTWECAVHTNIVFNRGTYGRLLSRMARRRAPAAVPQDAPSPTTAGGAV
ncbi:MAG: radical SAM protein [Acidobacteriota bacterium]